MKEWIHSFNCAVQGIITALKSEKHMRVHYVGAIIVMIVSLFYDFSRLEFIALTITVSLVIITEMINTCIENIINLVSRDYHPLARIVKDISAGVVLISVLNALVVAYLLFFDRLAHQSIFILEKIKHSQPHLTFIAILLVILIILGLKTKYSKGFGTHFQGGIVSGHSAVAFLISTIITFVAKNVLVTFLTLFMALMVGESRIEGEIHSFREVALGAIVGILVGIFIFQIIG